MRRDPRLHRLSSEHHHALVLARRVAQAPAIDAELVAMALDAWEAELLPHFRVEEEQLLPALARTDAAHLVELTRADHDALAHLVSAARAGDLEALRAFADRLVAHVRFEERVLFEELQRRDLLATLHHV